MDFGTDMQTSVVDGGVDIVCIVDMKNTLFTFVLYLTLYNLQFNFTLQFNFYNLKRTFLILLTLILEHSGWPRKKEGDGVIEDSRFFSE